MSCLRCHTPTLLSWLPCHNCPSQLSCTSCHVLLSCSGHPVLSSLSCLYHPYYLRLSCPGCPILAVLPRLSCLSCPAPAFLSPALFPCCPVFLSCFYCPVLSVLSYMPCPRSYVLEILPWLSWLSRAVLTWLIIKWRIVQQMKGKIYFPETWGKCRLHQLYERINFFCLFTNIFIIFVNFREKKFCVKYENFRFNSTGILRLSVKERRHVVVIYRHPETPVLPRLWPMSRGKCLTPPFNLCFVILIWGLTFKNMLIFFSQGDHLGGM